MYFAGIAQLVEQLIRNEQVAGSNPFTGSSEIKPSRVLPVGLFLLISNNFLTYSTEGYTKHIIFKFVVWKTSGLFHQQHFILLVQSRLAVDQHNANKCSACFFVFLYRKIKCLICKIHLPVCLP